MRADAINVRKWDEMVGAGGRGWRGELLGFGGEEIKQKRRGKIEKKE